MCPRHMVGGGLRARMADRCGISTRHKYTIVVRGQTCHPEIFLPYAEELVLQILDKYEKGTVEFNLLVYTPEFHVDGKTKFVRLSLENIMYEKRCCYMSPCVCRPGGRRLGYQCAKSLVSRLRREMTKQFSDRWCRDDLPELQNIRCMDIVVRCLKRDGPDGTSLSEDTDAINKLRTDDAKCIRMRVTY